MGRGVKQLLNRINLSPNTYDVFWDRFMGGSLEAEVNGGLSEYLEPLP